jgi:RNA polymerase sigma-70 factor, ECF subfamily
MNENKLVKKARKGDSQAFGKLYDKYIDKIYRFIFFKVNNSSEAEDITQQVFLKSWQNIKNYKPKKGAQFSSWLYRIARNSVIDHYRTSKNHTDIESIKEDEFIETPEFEEKIDRFEKINKVKKSLYILTEDEKDVVIMKFVEEFSNKEIGKVLDKNQGTIRVIQYRALKKLKLHFKDYDE